MFPSQAGSSRAVEVENDSPVVLHLPELRLVVVIDCGGAGDLQPADQLQVDQFGVEAGPGAVLVECDGCGFHVIE